MRFFQMVFGPAGAKEPVIYLPLVKDNRLFLLFSFSFCPNSRHLKLLFHVKQHCKWIPEQMLKWPHSSTPSCSPAPNSHPHLLLPPPLLCCPLTLIPTSLPPPPPPINLLCSVFIPPYPPNPPSAPSHPHLSAFLPHYPPPPPPSAPSHPFSLTSHFCQ